MMIDEDKKDDELGNGWMREDAEEHDEDISERLNINEIWQDCITPLTSEV